MVAELARTNTARARHRAHGLTRAGDHDQRPRSPGDPKNTILGPAQVNWLKGALLRSTGTCKVLAQQVMMGMARQSWREGQTPGFAMDQWPGYAAERTRLVRFLADRRVPNPVVLLWSLSHCVSWRRVNCQRPSRARWGLTPTRAVKQ